MGHDQHHSTKNIKAAFFLNLLFSIIEIIGGVLTNSVAIVSDAIHDLGDSISLGIAWYFQKVAGKEKTASYSFGFKRFSVLGAIINSVVLTAGSVFILIEASKRLIDPVMPDAAGMIWLSILGLLVNGIAAYRLSHGHSINEKAVYLHLLEDVLGWTATLIVSIVLMFWDLPILDPILSISVSAFILWNVVKNVRKSIDIILQGTPDDIDIEELHQSIKKIPEIKDVHDCHLWTMDGDYHVLSFHAVIADNSSFENLSVLKSKTREVIHSKFKIDHITIEFEAESEECQPC
ncbi:MAG: cation transporter [Cyclobacteriaceae bacterium]